jgi:hypothetical protein
MLKTWKSQLGKYGYTPNFYTSDICVIIKVSKSSWESDNGSTTPEIPLLLNNLKFHIYNTLALGPVLIIYNYEIWGYHVRVDRDPRILAYDAMSNGTQLLFFQKSLLPPCLNQSSPKISCTKKKMGALHREGQMEQWANRGSIPKLPFSGHSTLFSMPPFTLYTLFPCPFVKYSLATLLHLNHPHWCEFLGFLSSVADISILQLRGCMQLDNWWPPFSDITVVSFSRVHIEWIVSSTFQPLKMTPLCYLLMW